MEFQSTIVTDYDRVIYRLVPGREVIMTPLTNINHIHIPLLFLFFGATRSGYWSVPRRELMWQYFL